MGIARKRGTSTDYLMNGKTGQVEAQLADMESMLNKLCQILKIEDEFLNLIYYEQTIRF